MSKPVEQWFKEYGSSHQNPTNKAIHWIMVPAIYFSIVGLIWNVSFAGPGSWLNLATLIAIPIHLFYLRLSKGLALGMVVFTLACFVGNHLINTQVAMPLWQVSLWIFGIAWVFQFIGHKIEGKKPSFFEDLQYLLIGPLWLMGFVFQRFGWWQPVEA